MSKIEGTLESKKRLAELQKDYETKSQVWNEKLKALPKPKEVQELQDRLNKVKTSNFKSPQELVDSVNQLKAIADEANGKYKQLEQTGQQMSAELKAFDQGLKELDALVKKDIAELETRFRIPQLNPKNLAEGVFRSYLNPYLARMNEFKEMAEKYMPPNLLKKDKSEPEVAIQPRPREKGVTYEFGRPRAYPLFWVKKISVSSKANADLGMGDLSGLITDVTSNQVLVGKPTIASLNGDFPSLQMQGFAFKGTFDNRGAESMISYQTSVQQYPLEPRPLISSDDVQVDFLKADAAFESQGQLGGLRDLQFSLKNSLKKVDYKIEAKNTTVQEILRGVFTSLPVLTIDADGKGRLPGLELAINSNLGPELQRGFEREVKKKIDEARVKIQAYINEQVGAQKAKLEADYNKVKAQVDGEIKKVQAQLDAQKKQAESKADQAKKDEENKAKKQLEEKGKSTVDELKKRFGL